MDPDVRSDVQPVFEGDHVIYGGRRMPRVRGGEAVPGEAPAAAEPSAGGQGDQDLGLYDLNAVPEALRPHLEPILKEIEGNATKKFTEHAEFRKQWEPLAAVDGLADVPPEELSEFIEFREILGDDDKFAEWWTQIGEKAGLLEPDGEPGGDGRGDPGDDDPEVAELREQLAAVTQKLEQFEQKDTQRDQTEAQREQAAKIRSSLDALHSHEHYPKKDDGSPDDQVIIELAFAYSGDDDAIDKGFKRYLQIAGKAQGALVDDKLEQPGPALPRGKPDTAPPEIKTFKEAKAFARARG